MKLYSVNQVAQDLINIGTLDVVEKSLMALIEATNRKGLEELSNEILRLKEDVFTQRMKLRSDQGL